MSFFEAVFSNNKFKYLKDIFKTNRVESLLPTPLNRKLLSFVVDLVISLILFEIFIKVLSYVDINIINFKADTVILYKYLNYAGNGTNSVSSAVTNVAIEIVSIYGFIFSIYSFLTSLIFNRTIGNIIFDVNIVVSDSSGNPKSLDIFEKFIRFLLLPFVSFMLSFIPSLPLFFSKYERSLVDYISGTYNVTNTNNKGINYITYVLIAVLLLLFILSVY